MSQATVQIIEDEADQAELLSYCLTKAGFRTRVSYDGAEGLAQVQREATDVVLLDLMLPGLDGKEVCRRLRGGTDPRRLGIIILSALGEEEHRVGCFSLGADDYVLKPFSPREVVARVEAVLRRPAPWRTVLFQHPPMGVAVEDLLGVVRFRGRQLVLTAEETHILDRLASVPGVLVSSSTLSKDLSQFVADERQSLGSHVARLKQKLENDRIGRIECVSNVGYRLLPLVTGKALPS